MPNIGERLLPCPCTESISGKRSCAPSAMCGYARITARPGINGASSLWRLLHRRQCAGIRRAKSPGAGALVCHPGLVHRRVMQHLPMCG